MKWKILFTIFIMAYFICPIFGMPNLAIHIDDVIRLKRSTKSQKLNDPGGCVQQCLSECNSKSTDIKANSKLKLIMEARKNGWTAGSAQLKNGAISNVRDMMKELCKSAGTCQSCLSNCPSSPFKSLVLIQEDKRKDSVCYPSSVSDFKAYYDGEECTKKIQDHHQCKSTCGSSTSVSSATGFDFDPKASPPSVQYESDKKTNAAAAGKACKSQKCLLDCNKRLLVSQCGSSAYESYSREKKYEAALTLASLRYMGVLDSSEPAECADFH